MRGWILNVVSVGTLFSALAMAPTAAAESLAERLGFGSGGDEPAPTVMRDPNVRPAAAVAAREANMQGGQRRASGGGGGGGGGGSLFSRLHLPSFSSRSQQQAAVDEPPAAYDPAAVSAPGTRTQASGTAGTAARAPVRRTGTAATGQARGAAGAGTTATRTTTQQRPATQPRPATPRVARSSPRTDNRHNELADALTGLRDAPEGTQVEAGEADAAADAVVTPPAATRQAAPRYLDEGSSSAGDAATTPVDGRGTSSASGTRGWSQGPVDVGDALSGGVSGSGATRTAAMRHAASSSAAHRATTQTAPPVQSTPVQAAPAPTTPQVQTAAPARRATTQAAAPARRSPPRPPVFEADVAESLQADIPAADAPMPENEDSVEETLGAISAEPAPSRYQAEQSAPAAPAATRPSNPMRNQSTTSAVGVQAGIGRMRPKPGLPKTAESQGDVLLSCRPPMIVSNVTGPQRIVAGRPAEYCVEIENDGERAARDLVATITVPGSAEVLDVASSNGVIDRGVPASEGAPQTISWQLYELAAGASQTLTLKLSPQGGQSLQLVVECSQAPTSAEAMVEVQEPKLQMEIAGPSEVLFGKSQRYTLTLANPGTGAAEDVLIELTPPGGDPNSPVRHKVGTLAAGASKTIELELTAREAGDLKMLAAASGAGELRTETVKTVLCRRPKLDVDWRGPEQNFAGAVATYYLRVRNPGTAPAEQVGVVLSLPAGAELVDASTGHSWDAARRTVTWQPGSLAASEERFMQVRCRLSKPGVNQLELVAHTAAGDLSDVQSVPVTVEALADLKLQVSDPEGVLPVGETALYEIHVANRGQTAAHGVNVIAMFSEGIEPSQVEGGQHEIRDGRVSFRTIDTLPAGAEVVLRIHAKATTAGTHVFRTEVVCDDLETKLVAEETTRYFVEEERWADASSAYSEQAEAATR